MIKLIICETELEIAEITWELLSGCGAGGTAALSFGSTYMEIFREWDARAAAGGIKALPALFPADERRVPLSDPRSNWGSSWRKFSSAFGTKEDRSRWPSDKKATSPSLRNSSENSNRNPAPSLTWSCWEWVRTVTPPAFFRQTAHRSRARSGMNQCLRLLRPSIRRTGFHWAPD